MSRIQGPQQGVRGLHCRTLLGPSTPGPPQHDAPRQSADAPDLDGFLDDIPGSPQRPRASPAEAGTPGGRGEPTAAQVVLLATGDRLYQLTGAASSTVDVRSTP